MGAVGAVFEPGGGNKGANLTKMEKNVPTKFGLDVSITGTNQELQQNLAKTVWRMPSEPNIGKRKVCKIAVVGGQNDFAFPFAVHLRGITPYLLIGNCRRCNYVLYKRMENYVLPPWQQYFAPKIDVAPGQEIDFSTFSVRFEPAKEWDIQDEKKHTALTTVISSHNKWQPW